MTGGGGRPKVNVPAEPAPTPTPVPGREVDQAKKKVKKKTGRSGTVKAGGMLASRLNSDRNNTDVLKTRLG